jgi:acetyltransferase-like isoleucine patch superfamily enzyme
VIILDGVCIGTKTIIGAGAVVTNEIPANSIATGVPAKVARTRIRVES